MAVYKKLLLSEGGGIIPGVAHAKLNPNDVHIFIGLGGTGGDCLRVIKKAVKSRLKCDDDSIVDEPEFKHIRFLYIDSDDIALGLNHINDDSDDILDHNELLDISNDSIKVVIKAGVTKEISYLDWLNDDIDVTCMGGYGAGGVRQAGRFMFMENADTYAAKIEGIIREAKRELSNPSVFIHIASGLCGGTGSGIFLDVCYLTKHILYQNGGGNVLGYFFTPDVNLSRIPNSEVLTRNYIPINGYAAMQELEYCMNISSNGGAFTQNYKNIGNIRWDEAPVDLCHIISATDSQMNVIENAYDYAMNAVAEYIMTFISEPESEYHSLRGCIADCCACINIASARKTIGTAVNYLALGVSCASVPIREINTYLAAGIFEKLGNTVYRIADYNSVFDIAERAGLDRWENVIKAIEENGGSAYIKGPDWKEHKIVSRDFNSNSYAFNVMSNQYGTIVGVHKRNAEVLVAPDNPKSYIRRIMQQLDDCCKDYQRGTDFANSVIVGEYCPNLINIVDGLIKAIDLHIEDRNYQITREGGARANYQAATAALQNKGNRKNYTNYVYYNEQLNELECQVSSAEFAKEVLEKLREQLIHVQANYYGRLNQVFKDLVGTFRYNYEFLLNAYPAGLNNTSFEMKIITIEDIQDDLDRKIDSVNLEHTMNYLIGLLMNNQDVWVYEINETKLTGLINAFFVNHVFADYAGRSITNYLKDKYKDDVTAKQLENNISRDYIVPLINKSEPLFPMNNLWAGMKQEIDILSVPRISQEIINASNNTAQVVNAGYVVNMSALTDRISCIRCYVGIPLGAFRVIDDYRKSYFTSNAKGIHLYEGKGSSALFNDWNKLPFTEPLSFVQMSNDFTDKEEKILAEFEEFFSNAAKYGLFGDYEKVYKLSSETVDALHDILNRKDEIFDIWNKQEIIDLSNEITEILDPSKFIDSGYHVEPVWSAGVDKREPKFKDALFHTPAIQRGIKDDLKLINDVLSVKDALDERVKFIEYVLVSNNVLM